MDEIERKIKEKFNRDFPIEYYGETAYKALMNDYVRMEFTEQDLRFFHALGLIDLDDPEMQEILIRDGKEIEFGAPKDKIHEDILEDYQIYGFAKIKNEIENGVIRPGIEDKIKEEIYAQRNEIRRAKDREAQEITRDDSLWEMLVR